MRDWIAKDRDRWNTQCRVHNNACWHSRRMRVIERLGGKCQRCGILDWRVLQIDHINGNGTQEIRARGSDGICAKILAMPDVEWKKEYQLLCSNCNWIKRYENKEHGKRKCQVN